MLDIKSLRLTDKDMVTVNKHWEGGYKGLATEIADAQLEKALWGVQEWLTKASVDPKGYTLRVALIELNTLLTKDYPKPEED